VEGWIKRKGEGVEEGVKSWMGGEMRGVMVGEEKGVKKWGEKDQLVTIPRRRGSAHRARRDKGKVEMGGVEWWGREDGDMKGGMVGGGRGRDEEVV
jgi:hypothetical protein